METDMTLTAVAGIEAAGDDVVSVYGVHGEVPMMVKEPHARASASFLSSRD